MKSAYRYCFKEHWATFLHYDFRIDIGNGDALSFAINYGPSMRPNVERLAIEMPMHLSRTMFLEGRIPDGREGAGETRVWDKGIITSDQDIRFVLRSGSWIFSIQGERLNGEFQLLLYPDKGREWALIKLPDKYAEHSFVLKTLLKPETTNLAYRHWLTEIAK